MDEKEVYFTSKRIDESWKESVSKEKTNHVEKAQTNGVSFSAFLTSLGIQALIQLGELAAPGSKESEINLSAAQETIDLLVMLKDKTKGNLTKDEETLLNALIADLQLKFVQHKIPS